MSVAVTPDWCRIYGCWAYVAEGSEFCAHHQHAANEKPNGRVLPKALELVAAADESGPVEPAPSPEGEERSQAGGGASSPHRKTQWTLERCIPAVREVAEKVGHTPTRAEMKAAGYVSVTVSSTTLLRLGLTWDELVREAGYEPLKKAARKRRPKTSGRAARPAAATRNGNTAASPVEELEREPEATDPAEAEVAPSRRALLAAEGATSRSDVLLRAAALAARAFADAILEDAA